jgi:hypothetical protein
MRATIAALVFALAAAALAPDGSAGAADPALAQGPLATTAAQARDVADPAANDFLRLVFVPPNTKVGGLGLRQARVFLTATSYFLARPAGGLRRPLPLSAVAKVTGGAYSAAFDVAAMRCKLPDPAQSAMVATWPNVFAAVVVDLPAQACDPMPANPSVENQLYCLARSYREGADPLAVKPLAAALDIGLAMMQAKDSDGGSGAGLLAKTYGIGDGFGGLGYSVAGSLNTSLNAEQVLQQSVVTEYLVKRASLREAGCRCIQVPAYTGRDLAPLDPDYIAAKGKLGADGVCVRVGRLGLTPRAARAAR